MERVGKLVTIWKLPLVQLDTGPDTLDVHVEPTYDLALELKSCAEAPTQFPKAESPTTGTLTLERGRRHNDKRPASLNNLRCNDQTHIS